MARTCPVHNTQTKRVSKDGWSYLKCPEGCMLDMEKSKPVPVCPFIEHPKGCACQAMLTANTKGRL